MYVVGRHVPRRSGPEPLINEGDRQAGELRAPRRSTREPFSLAVMVTVNGLVRSSVSAVVLEALSFPALTCSPARIRVRVAVNFEGDGVGAFQGWPLAPPFCRVVRSTSHAAVLAAWVLATVVRFK